MMHSMCTDSLFAAVGIIRRVESEVPGKGPTTHDLPRFIRRKLEDLLEDKRLREGDIEGRALSQLMELPEAQAEEAVDKFCNADLDTIRSKTGFLMGTRHRPTAMKKLRIVMLGFGTARQETVLE
jgi:hypothetical protein